MQTDKRLYQIALTRIVGVGDIIGRNLLQAVGDEETIFRLSIKELMDIKGVNKQTAQAIRNAEVLILAEKELNFVDKNNIATYFINQPSYPQRLRDCADAPLLMYTRGNIKFGEQRIISIVGTRNATNYGISFCDNFLKEIAAILPDALIVSGLAYGIDIAAHRAALKNNLSTIGVLAHGLDRVYPAIHQQTANEMLEHGGLLSEFVSGTEPDKYNFVRRNRIVAGIADALIVVESNAKGGSLITAEIASSYCKDIFAVPGRLTDAKSAGCNNLIAKHKADALLSTKHFLEQMGWDNDSQKKKKAPRQQSLFLELTPDEASVVEALKSGVEFTTDQLAKETAIPVYTLVSLLFEMEMKGLLNALPGNRYAIR